jgi:hypothetical protein
MINLNNVIPISLVIRVNTLTQTSSRLEKEEEEITVYNALGILNK